MVKEIILPSSKTGQTTLPYIALHATIYTCVYLERFMRIRIGTSHTNTEGLQCLYIKYQNRTDMHIVLAIVSSFYYIYIIQYNLHICVTGKICWQALSHGMSLIFFENQTCTIFIGTSTNILTAVFHDNILMQIGENCCMAYVQIIQEQSNYSDNEIIIV